MGGSGYAGEKTVLRVVENNIAVTVEMGPKVRVPCSCGITGHQETQDHHGGYDNNLTNNHMFTVRGLGCFVRVYHSFWCAVQMDN